MEIVDIGIVKTSVTEEKDSDWGEVVSEIHVNEEYIDGLKGIEGNSYLIIIFFMHNATFDRSKDLIRHPRGRVDLPLLGIFSQRAKHRPNPIGITPVKLLGCEGNVLKVQGLDAIDGTPVLDIKPYVPHFDRIEDAKAPDWIETIMKDYF
jgi:tRNA-Thr(GGU) m(6)t(6)A37 methyltransferase TsaA